MLLLLLLREVLQGRSWWGGLDCGSRFHAVEDLEGWKRWGVVAWEVGLGRVEAGWWGEDWRRLVHHLVEDLRRRRRGWRGVLDGYVVGGVVDDDLLG